MLSIIIIALVIVGLVGFLRSLTPEERLIFGKATKNIAVATVVYTARTGKETIKTVYNTGVIAGTTMAIEGQETINSVDEFNNDIKTKGGAIKNTIRIHRDHAQSLGLSEMANEIEALTKQKLAELEALRAARRAS